MRLLVILPNWLGDALMATPAIEAVINYYKIEGKLVELTLVGSYVSIEALKYHPNCVSAIVDETKKESSRLLATYKLAKKIGKQDVAITFRNQFHSSLLLYFTRSGITAARKSWHASALLKKSVALSRDEHLVVQYYKLVQSIIGMSTSPSHLKLFIEPEKVEGKRFFGINAGATYGAAKRWYPERFAAVAANFAKDFDIVIFGGPSEVTMAQEIEDELVKLGVSNFENVAGKTDIKSLCAKIGALSFFVTNDSGPMHVAAAYQIPTVAIFGPTRYKETSQWMNPKSAITRVDVECSPCMKRECPIPKEKAEHHQCMKLVDVAMVSEAVKRVLKK